MKNSTKLKYLQTMYRSQRRKYSILIKNVGIYRLFLQLFQIILNLKWIKVFKGNLFNAYRCLVFNT